MGIEIDLEKNEENCCGYKISPESDSANRFRGAFIGGKRRKLNEKQAHNCDKRGIRSAGQYSF